ncbi:hypothetical protein SLE2022_193760 [Rubroshorea leprosula]
MDTEAEIPEPISVLKREAENQYLTSEEVPPGEWKEFKSMLSQPPETDEHLPRTEHKQIAIGIGAETGNTVSKGNPENSEGESILVSQEFASEDTRKTSETCEVDDSQLRAGQEHEGTGEGEVTKAMEDGVEKSDPNQYNLDLAGTCLMTTSFGEQNNEGLKEEIILDQQVEVTAAKDAPLDEGPEAIEPDAAASSPMNKHEAASEITGDAMDEPDSLSIDLSSVDETAPKMEEKLIRAPSITVRDEQATTESKCLDEDNMQGDAASKGVTGNDPAVEVRSSISIRDEKLENPQVKYLLEATPILHGGDKDYKGEDADERNGNIREGEVHDGPEIMCPTEATKEIVKDNDMLPLPQPIEERFESFRDNENKEEKSEQGVDTECVTKKGQNEDIRLESAEVVSDQDFQPDEKDADKFEGEKLEKSEAAAEESIVGETSQTAESPEETLNASMVRQEDKLQIECKSPDTTEPLPEEKGDEEKSFVILAEGSSNDIKQGDTDGQNEKTILENEEDSKILQESEQGKKLEHSLHLTLEEAERIPSDADKIPSLMEETVQNPVKTLGDEENVTGAIDNHSNEEKDTTKEDLKLDTETSDASKAKIISEEEIKVGEMAVEAFTKAYKLESQEKTEYEDVMKDMEVNTKKEEAEEVHEGTKTEDKEEDTGKQSINESQNEDASPDSTAEESHESLEETKKEEKMVEIEVHEQHETTNTFEDDEKLTQEEKEISDAAGKGAIGNDPSVEVSSSISITDEKLDNFQVKNVPEATPIFSGGDKDYKGDDADERNNNITEEEVHDGPEIICPLEATKEIIEDNNLFPLPKLKEEERFESFRDNKNKEEKSERGVDTECVTEEGQNEDIRPESAEEVPDQDFQVDEKDADKFEGEKLEKSEAAAEESIAGETSQTAESPQETLNSSMVRQEDKLQFEYKSVDTTEALPEEKGNEEKSFVILAEGSSNDIKHGETVAQNERKILENEEDSKILHESEQGKKLEHSMHPTSEGGERIPSEADKIPSLMEGVAQNPVKTLGDEEKVTEAIDNKSIEEKDTAKEDLKLDTETSDASKESVISEQEIKAGEMAVEASTEAYKLHSQEKTEYEDVMKNMHAITKEEDTEEVQEGAKIEDKEEETVEQSINDESQNGDASPESTGEESHESLQEAKKEEKMPEIEEHEQHKTTDTSDAEKLTLEEEISDAADENAVGNVPSVEVSSSISIIDEKLENFQVKNVPEATTILSGGDRDYEGEDADERNNNITEEEVHDGPEIICPSEATKEIIKDDNLLPLPKLTEEERFERCRDDKNEGEKSEQGDDTEHVTKDGQYEDLRPESAEQVLDQSFRVDEKDTDKFEGEKLQKSGAAAEESIAGETSHIAESPQETLNTSTVRQEDIVQIEYKSADTTEALPEEKGKEEKSFVILAEGSSNDIKQGETEGQNEKKILENEEDSKILQESEQGKNLEHSLHLTSEETERIPSEADKIPSLLEGVVQNLQKTLGDEEKVTEAIDNKSIEEKDTTKEDLKPDTETSDASKESVISEQEIKAGEMAVEAFTKAYKLDTQEKTEYEDVTKDMEVNTKKEDTEEVQQGAKIEDKEEETVEQSINDESQNGDASPESIGEESHESLQEAKKEEKMPEIEEHEQHKTTDTSDAEKLTLEEEEISDAAGKGAIGNDPSVEVSSSISITDEKLDNFQVKNVPEATPIFSGGDKDYKGDDADERNNNITEEEVHDGPEIICPLEATKEIIEDNNLFPLPKLKEEERFESFRDNKNKEEKSERGVDTDCVTEEGQNEDIRPESAEEVPDQDFQVDEKDADKFEGEKLEKSEAAAEESIVGETSQTAESPEETLNTSMVRQEDKLQIECKSPDTTEALPEEKGNEEKSFVILAQRSSNDIKQGDTDGQNEKTILENEEDSKILQESEQGKKLEHSLHLMLEEAERIPSEADKIPSLMEGVAQNPVKTLADEEKVTEAIDNKSIEEKDTAKEDLKLDTDTSDASKESIISEQEIKAGETAVEAFTKACKLDSQEKTEYEDVMKDMEVNTKEEDTEEVQQSAKIEDKEEETVEQSINDESQNGDASPESIGEESHESLQEAKKEEKMPEIEEHEQHKATDTSDAEKLTLEEEEISNAAGKNAVGNVPSVEVSSSISIIDEKLENFQVKNVPEATTILSGGDRDYEGEDADERNNNITEEEVHDGPEIICPSEATKEIIKDDNLLPLPRLTEEGRFERCRDDKNKGEKSEQGDDTERVTKDGQYEDLRPESAEQVLDQSFQVDEKDADKFEGEKLEKSEAAAEESIAGETSHIAESSQETLDTSTMRQEDILQIEYKSADTTEALPEEKGKEEKSFVILAEGSSNDIKQGETEGQNETKILENEEDSQILQESEQGKNLEHSLHLTSEETERIPSEADKIPSLLEGVVQNLQKTLGDEEKVTEAIDNKSIEEKDTTKEDLKPDTETSDASKESVISEQEIKAGEMAVEAFTKAYKLDSQEKTEYEDVTKDMEVNTKKEDTEEVHEGAKIEDKEEDTGDAAGKGAIGNDPSVEVSSSISIIDEKLDNFQVKNVPEATPILSGGDKDYKVEDADERNNNITEEEVHDGPELICPLEATKEIIEDNNLLPLPKLKEEERFESFRDNKNKEEKSEQGVDTECVTEEGQNEDIRPESTDEVPDQNFQVDEKDADKFEGEKLEKSEAAAEESIVGETSQTAESPEETLNTSMVRQEDKLQIECKSPDTTEALPEEKGNEEKSFVILAPRSSNDIKQGDTDGQNEKTILENEEDSKILQESEQGKKLEHSLHLTLEEAERIPSEADKIPSLMEGVAQNPVKTLGDEEKVTEAIDNKSIEEKDTAKEDLKLDADTSDASKESIISEQEIKAGETAVEAFTKAYKLDSQEKTEYEDVMKDMEVNTKEEDTEEVQQGAKIEDKEEETVEQSINDESQNGDASPESIGEESHESLQEAKKEEKMPEIEEHEQHKTTDTLDAEKLTLEEEEISNAAGKNAVGNVPSVEVSSSISIIDEKLENFQVKNVPEATTILSGGDRDYEGEDADERNNNITEEEVHDGPEIICPSEATKEIIKDDNLLPLPRLTEEERFERCRDDKNKAEKSEQGDDTERVTKDGQYEDLRPESAEQVLDQSFQVDEKDADKFEGEKLEKSEAAAEESIAGETSHIAESPQETLDTSTIRQEDILQIEYKSADTTEALPEEKGKEEKSFVILAEGSSNDIKQGETEGQNETKILENEEDSKILQESEQGKNLEHSLHLTSEETERIPSEADKIPSLLEGVVQNPQKTLGDEEKVTEAIDNKSIEEKDTTKEDLKPDTETSDASKESVISERKIKAGEMVVEAFTKAYKLDSQEKTEYEDVMKDMEVNTKKEDTEEVHEGAKIEDKEEDTGDAAGKGAIGNDPSVEVSCSISIIDEKLDNFQVKNVPEATPILSGGDKDYKVEDADERNNNITEEEVHDGPELICPLEATKEIIEDNNLLPLPKLKEEERFERFRDNKNKEEKSERGVDTECVTEEGQNEDIRPESTDEVPDQNFQVDEKDADKFEGEKLEKSEAAAEESIAGEPSQTAEGPQETLNTSMLRQEDKLQLEYKSVDTTEDLPKEKGNEEKSFVILAPRSSNDIKQGDTDGQNEKTILENEEDSKILQESEQGKKLEHSLHLTLEEAERIPSEADKIPSLMEGVAQNPVKTLGDEEKVTEAIDNKSIEEKDTAKEDLKLDADTSDASKESIISEQEIKAGETAVEAFTKAYKLDSQEKTEYEDVMKDMEVNTKEEDTEEVQQGAKIEDKEEETVEQSINDESQNGDASPESIGEESHESLQEAKKEEKMPEIEEHEQHKTTDTLDAEKLTLEEEEISNAAGKNAVGNVPSVEVSSSISIIDEKLENFQVKNVPEATTILSGGDRDYEGEDADERNNNITEEEVHDGPEIICPSEATKEIIKDDNLLPLLRLTEEERFERCRDDKNKGEKSEQGDDTERVTKDGQYEDLRPESAEQVLDQCFQVDEKDADKFEGEKLEKSEAAAEESIAGETSHIAESPQETLDTSTVRQEDILQIEYESADTTEAMPEEKGKGEKSFVILAEGSSNDIKKGETEGQNEMKILENEEDSKILQESEQGKNLEHSLHPTSEETERIPSEADKIPSLLEGVVQNPRKTVGDEEKATGAIDNNSIEENDTIKEDLKLYTQTPDASKESIISEQEIEVGEMEVEEFTMPYKLDSQENTEYEDLMKDIEVNTRKEEAEVHEGAKIEDKEEDTGDQSINDESQNEDASPGSTEEESHESLQEAKKEEKMPEVEVHEQLETTNTLEDAEILTLEEEEISDAAGKGATGNDPSVELSSSISIKDEKVENDPATTPILSGVDKDDKGEDADERNIYITEEEVHEGPETICHLETTKEIIKDNNLLPMPKQTEEERFESFRDDKNKAEKSEEGDDTEYITIDGQNEDLKPESAEEVPDQSFQVDKKDSDKFEGEKLEKSETAAGESIPGETSQTAESPQETFNTSMVRQEDKLQIEYESADTTEALPEEKGNEEESFFIPAEASSNDIKQGETEGQNENKILKNEEDSKILQEGEQWRKLEPSLHLTSEKTERIPSEADKIPSLMEEVVQNPGKTLGDEEKAAGAIDNNSIEENDTEKEDLKLDTETSDASKKSIISEQELQVGAVEVEAFTKAYKLDSQEKTEYEDVMKDIEVNTKKEEADEVHEGAKIEDMEEDTGEQSINDKSQNGDASPESIREESHESLQEAKNEEKMPEIEVHEQLETTSTFEDAEKLTLEEEEISDAASKGAAGNDPSVEVSSSISIKDEKVENFQVKNDPETTPILSEGDKDYKEEDADERNINITEEEVLDGPETICHSETTKEITKDNNLFPLPKQTEEERFESCRDDKIKAEKLEQGDDTEYVRKDGQNEDHRPESAEEVLDQSFQVDEKDADKFEGEKLEKSEAAAEESIAGETSQTAESPQETLNTSMVRQEDKLQIECKSADTTEALPEEKGNEEESFVIQAEGSSNDIKQGETEGQNENKILKNEEDSKILQESEQGKELEHSLHLTLEEAERIPSEADKIPSLMEGVVQNPEKTLGHEEKATGAIDNNSIEENDTAKEDLKLDNETSDASKEKIISEQDIKVSEMEVEALTKAYKLDSQEKTEYEDVMEDIEVNTKKEEAEEVHEGAKIEDKEEDTGEQSITDESQNGDASPESIGEESHESLQEAKNEEMMPEIEVHEQLETANTFEDAEKLTFEEDEISDAASKGATVNDPSVEVGSSISIIDEKLENFQVMNVLESTPILSGGDKDYKGKDADERNNNVMEEEVHDGPEIICPSEANKEITKDNYLLPLPKLTEEERFESCRDDENKAEKSEQRDDTECVTKDGQNEDLRPESAEEFSDQSFQVDEKDADKFDGEKLEKSEVAAEESIASETSQIAESPQETLDTSMMRQEDKLPTECKSADTTEALPEEKGNEEKSFVILAEGSSNDIKQGETEGQNEKRILENEEESKILQESEQGKKLEHSLQLTSEEAERIPSEADKIPSLVDEVVQDPGKTLGDEEKVTVAIDNNSIEENDTTKEDLKLDAETPDASKKSIISEQETKVGELEEEAFAKAYELDSQEKTEYEDVMKDIEVNTKKEESEVHDGGKIEDKEEDTEQSVINDESHNGDASPESIEEESYENPQEAKKEEKMPEIEVHEQPKTTNTSEEAESLTFEEEEISEHQSPQLADKMEEGSNEENAVQTVKEKEVCEAATTANSGISKENLGIEGNDKPCLFSSTKDATVEEISNKDKSSPMNLKEEVSDSSLALKRDIEETGPLEETTPQNTEDQPEQKNDHNPLDTTEDEIEEDPIQNSSFKSEVCKDTEELLEKERTNFSDTESTAAAKEEPTVREVEHEDNTEVGGSESGLPLEEKGLAATETKGVDLDSVDTNVEEDSTNSFEKDKEIPTAANEMQDEASNSVGEDQEEVTTRVIPLKEILEGDFKEISEVPLEEHGLVSTEAREINETSVKIQDTCETSESRSISPGVEEMLTQKEDNLSNTIDIPLLGTVDIGEESVDEIKKHLGKDRDLHTEQSAETYISKTKDAEVSDEEETRDEGEYEKPIDEALKCIEPSGIIEDDEKDINKAENSSPNLVGSLKDNTDIEKEATRLERSDQICEINSVNDEASQIEENLEPEELDQKLKHETESKNEDQSNETILDSRKSQKEENTTDAQNQEAENEKEEENEKVTGEIDKNSIRENDTMKEDLKLEAETSEASKESIISQHDTKVGEMELEAFTKTNKLDSQEKTEHEDAMKDIEVNTRKEEAEEVHEGAKIEDKDKDTEQSTINDEVIGQESHESLQEAKTEEKMPEIEVHEQLETTTTSDDGEKLMFVEEEISKHQSTRLTDKMEEGSNEENAVKIMTEKEENQVTQESKDIDTQKTSDGSSKGANNFDAPARVTNKEESLEKEDKEREPEKEVHEADITPDSERGMENLGIEENNHPALSSSTKDEVAQGKISKEDESSAMNLKEVVGDSSLAIMRNIDETGSVEETAPLTTEDSPEPKNDQHPLNITKEGNKGIILEEMKEDLVQNSSFESEVCKDTEELLEKERSNICYSESIAAATEQTKVKEADPEDNTEVGGSELPIEEIGLAATETKGGHLDSVDANAREDSSNSFEKEKEIPKAANEMQDETSESVGEDQKEVTTRVAPFKEILEGDLKENSEVPLEEIGPKSTEEREINETSEKIRDSCETSESHSISPGVEQMFMQKEQNLYNKIAVPLLGTVDTGEERVDEIKKHTAEDQDLHAEQSTETYIFKTKDAEISDGEEIRDEGEYAKPTDEAAKCIEPSGIREDDEKDVNEPDNSSTNLVGSLKDNIDVENEATKLERSNQINEVNNIIDEASQIEESLKPEEFDQKLKHEAESIDEDQSNETILDSNNSEKEENIFDAENQEVRNEKEGSIDNNSIEENGTTKEDLKLDTETSDASKESIISQQDTKVGEMEVEAFTNAYKLDSQEKTEYENEMEHREVNTKNEEAEKVHESAKIEDKEEDTEQSIVNEEYHIGDTSPESIVEESHESLEGAKTEKMMPEIEVLFKTHLEI